MKLFCSGVIFGLCVHKHVTNFFTQLAIALGDDYAF